MDLVWIEDNLLAAGAIPISNSEITALKSTGIKAIVTLTEYSLTSLDQFDADLFTTLDIELLHVPIVDMHPPSEDQAMRVYEFVSTKMKQSAPVFIHCEVGVGRTGTLLHAFYLYSGLDLASTKQRVANSRPISAFAELTQTQQTFLEALAHKLQRKSSP